MKRLRYLIYTFVGLFVFSTFGMAQEGGSKENSLKKQTGRTFRVACWSDWTHDEIYIRAAKGKNQKKMIKLEILDMSYSRPYPYKTGESLVFYKKTESEEKPYVPVMKVIIPKTFKKPLVMLILGKKSIKHMVYDLDAKIFPFGSYKIVNFTSVRLLTEFAGKRFLLDPKKDRFVRLKQSKQNKALQCKVSISNKGRKKLIYSNMMMNRKNKRMLMFFYSTKDEAGRTAIKCRSLVDFYSPPKQASN